MRKIIVIMCAVAMLLSLATMAFAVDGDGTQWVIYLRTGNLVGTTMSNGGDLVLGVKTAQADTAFTSYVATAANIASDNGTAMQKIEFQNQDLVGPVEYNYNVTIGVGASYPTAAQGRVYITAWSGTKYGLTTGYSMPDNYVVTIKKGTETLASWTRAEMWVGATTPTTGKTGLVGFWYTYDSTAGSFPESTDDFIVTVAPNVPEPGSLLALGSGLVGMLGFAIRRRRA